jgi:hypothetical protein
VGAREKEGERERKGAGIYKMNSTSTSSTCPTKKTRKQARDRVVSYMEISLLEERDEVNLTDQMDKSNGGEKMKSVSMKNTMTWFIFKGSCNITT